jgi:methylated-DNA-[protein]-cysteine S-methyltransferase
MGSSMFTLILFYTAKGYMGLLGSEKGLKRVILPLQKPKDVIDIASVDYIFSCDNNSTCLGDLPMRMVLYFEGKKVVFNDSIDIENVTEYQKKIWNTARQIPYGTTVSYGQLAQMAGNYKSARAAGNALARNPIPIVVPCHRVIGSNNKLGGFGGGLEMKRYLLELESPDKTLLH